MVTELQTKVGVQNCSIFRVSAMEICDFENKMKLALFLRNDLCNL